MSLQKRTPRCTFSLIIALLVSLGCASSPSNGKAGEKAVSHFAVPPLFHYAHWKEDGHFLYLMPLLALDFRGTDSDASRFSPWVIFPPLLYLDHERGVNRRTHVLFPFGYTRRRSANEETETALFPLWHSHKHRKWMRLGKDEFREIPSREWGLFPLFRVEEENGLIESLTIWPLLSRYQRVGRKRYFRLFFLIPIPLGEESLEDAIRSDVPAIRWDAADEIGRTRDRSHIPLLLEAMLSADRVLRYRAIQALEKLTLRKIRYDPDGSVEEREAQVARLRGS
ncbi:MAG: HEAT repeat domain-containing protein [Planctomycetota bacterium]|nr:HEAT repeat domain-containing protein [Planctomycetota bacterium]